LDRGRGSEEKEKETHPGLFSLKSARNRSSVEVTFNEEFLVSVSHQLALTTSSPLYTPSVAPTD